ncbi:MAG: hypothetical protein DRQ55_18070 [Planctomycetota bacterium]|nr:MAG: hypothetical protein DRQ55_18070 [Planctomycetota bacterium]
MLALLLTLALTLPAPCPHGSGYRGPSDAEAVSGCSVVWPKNPGPLPERAEPTVVTGRVLRELDGEPLPGARVHLKSFIDKGDHKLLGRNRGRWFETRTDDEGRFRLTVTGKLRAWGIQVDPTEHSTVLIADGRNLDARSPLELRAPVGGTIEGRVLDEQGRGVAGAYVAADLPLHGSVETETDDEGRYVLRQLPRRFRLDFFGGSGMIGAYEVLGGVAPWAHVSEVDLLMVKPRTIVGHVESRDGDPVPRVWLYAARTDTLVGHPFGFRRVSRSKHRLMTDADGRFSICDLAPGAVNLRWDLPGERRGLHQKLFTDGVPVVVRP